MKRRLLTIVLAAALAVFGVVAVLAYVRHANARAVNGLKAEKVMVAKAAIPAGTSLRNAQLRNLLSTEQVPVSSLSNATPVSAVTAANANLVMSANVASGELLLQNMLAPASSIVSSNSFVIPKGMIAVTVAMCIPEAVAGYVTAGSEVEVFATVPMSPKVLLQRACTQNHNALPPAAVSTVVVLAKVQVLTVAQASAAQSTSAGHPSVLADPASASSASSASSGAVLVTCAVTAQQAALLIQAVQVDLPYLALLQTSH